MVVKWGVIGCGDVAEHMGVPAICQAPNSKLVAVTDINADRARSFAERYNAKRYYDSIDKMLDDREIDATYVATPPYLHCQHVIQSAEAGKHTLCEKPMARSAKECKEMIRACKNNKVKLMVAYYRRFYPKIRKIKQGLDEYVIGRPVLVRLQNTWRYSPLDPTDPKEWRANQEKGGGGCLIEIGSHRLDLLSYLLGEMREVSAFTDTIVADYEVEDCACLIMRFRNGIHALVNFNWNTSSKTDDFEIYGDTGRIVASPLDTERLCIYDRDKVSEYELPRCEYTHLPVIENFVKSINGEAEVFIPGEEGMKANQIIDAAYESSRTGRVTRL